MRFTVALALPLLFITPVQAQLEADFAAANRILGQITPATVVDTLEGEWLPLTTLANLQGEDPDPGLIDSLLERICGNDPARGALITAIDASSFEMTAPNSGGDMVYRFDWVGGAQFLRSFDPAALFSMLKFDTMDGERGVEMRARALESTATMVSLYRVSPDLLAVAEPRRVEIYGRCAQ